MDPPTPGLLPPGRLRVGIGAVVVLIVVGLAIAVLVSALGSHGSTASVTAPAPSGTSPSAAASSGPGSDATGATIYIHVIGAVANPGLFLLHDGDRVVDAVGAAGGLTATADQSQVNLARLLVDGEQVDVPNVGDAPAPATGAAPPGVGSPTLKVNLNTADEPTLETLPRVGPAMAQRIIDWRTTNGRFTAVEDLLSVSGVGDKTFEQLKDLVTV